MTDDRTSAGRGTGLIAGYEVGPFFDEMLEAEGRPRPHRTAAPTQRRPQAD